MVYKASQRENYIVSVRKKTYKQLGNPLVTCICGNGRLTLLRTQDMETTANICKKKIFPFPTEHEVDRARNVFITRFIARFVQKHKKYIQLLHENGSSLPEAFSNFSVNVCESFEDEVDMIISEKRNKIKNACRIKGVYSVKGLFRQVYQIVRRARAARIESKLTDVSKQDIMDSLTDIANELAYAYEYQIVMLISEQEVRQLADQAVSCVMNYLKHSDALFLRCNILEALTDVPPRKSFRRAEKVSTRIMKIDGIKGNRYQKWCLSEVFKQPGLRMPKLNSSGYVFYGCFTPYGSLCRPNKYGFRGPIHVWDEKQSKFVLLFNDQVSVSPKHRTEIARDPTDVHQNYEPVMLCAHFEPDLCVSSENLECNKGRNNQESHSTSQEDKSEPDLNFPSEILECKKERNNQNMHLTFQKDVSETDQSVSPEILLVNNTERNHEESLSTFQKDISEPDLSISIGIVECNEEKNNQESHSTLQEEISEAKW